MTVEEIKNKINTTEYDFLKTDAHLGDNIILLGLGGSHAYGTNMETSDIDIRGCALNSVEDLLVGNAFEQFTNEATDTVIYSFNKMVNLLANCNPNVIEILGLKPEHYLYKDEVGESLIANADMFLSKRAIHTFGGYASQQLYRLNNLTNRYVGQEEMEKHILKTIESAETTIKERFLSMPDDALKLYIDKAVNEDMDTEIFMDVNLSKYPLRDYAGLWNELKTIVSSYNKVGQRNSKAKEHGKITKHMMHLIRLYMMCIDILEKQQIITFREDEHDLLMSIRNGAFVDDSEQPTKEFFDLVDQYEKRFDEAKKNTLLPDKPDMKKINDFVIKTNLEIIKNNRK